MRILSLGLVSIFFLVSSSIVAYGAVAAPQTWEFRDGRWQQVATKTTTQPVIQDEQLDRVEELIEAHQSKSAITLSLNWLKNHKDHDAAGRDRALFLMAEALFQYGNRIKSYYYFDELMEEYPESPLFYPALQRQYDIADAYLSGYKRRFLMIPMLGAEEEAIEMLYRIQQHSPGSPLAEKSLLRTADYYFANSEFDLAHDAYSAYAKGYPRSPVISKVKLRQAFSSLALFRGVKFDASPAIDAREELRDINMAYPELAADENVPAVVDGIDSSFARKLYYTADFYRRTKEPVAAVYTYRFLIKSYPNSMEAERARVALAKMPPSALDTPEPQSAEGYAPTTMPAQVQVQQPEKK
jgi:outer membrane assembly lipoprotein YfiO